MARPRVREQLLDAAYDLLQREGIAALTTRHIASCAGTTEASVFNNFGDKAGLLYALIGERLPEVQAVKSAIDADLQDDVAVWLENVYQAAELFYIAIIPLTAPLWGREGLGDGQLLGDRHPLHGLVVARFLQFQREGVLGPGSDACALATIVLGAALHNGFNLVAHGRVALAENRNGQPGRLVTSLLPLFGAVAT
ncbi:TetR/AcrR family transcriptional regulator [Zhongshania aquimaris]|uniref:TetR/AcrR family transcriptional regulator n=1 Tax=Zhongshania aquimaris TaxID=2857107 RepID=A0ABS6VVC4_9GAMM|nr:TetR/AcrR family transcriptional regulator [Zhongshania aquimaris]MBW2942289.1 TetR/AcrR family transcriptional regulator [Zhongshania aquimaris]